MSTHWMRYESHVSHNFLSMCAANLKAHKNNIGVRVTCDSYSTRGQNRKFHCRTQCVNDENNYE